MNNWIPFGPPVESQSFSAVARTATKEDAEKANSNLGAFLEAQHKEIDSLYESWGATLNSYYFDMPDRPPVKLTTRQKLRYAGYRIRSAIAAPFAWVVKLLDPSRLDQGDD